MDAIPEFKIQKESQGMKIHSLALFLSHEKIN